MCEFPLVGVITPTLNRPNKLKKALSSVLNQTYPNIEIIVVDGGSTDETPEIVEQIRESKQKVTYIRNEKPQGLPSARNQGIYSTKAKYVAFLDDDDFWHEKKTEKQIKRIEKENDNVGGVFCGRRSVTPSGEHIDTRVPAINGALYEDLLVENIIGSPSGVIVKNKVIKSLGGFDETMSFHEDWDFYIRLSRKYSWCCVPEPLFTRTIHQETMSKKFKKRRLYRKKVLKRNYSQLDSLNLKNKALAVHYKKAGIEYCKQGKTKLAREILKKSLSKEIKIKTVILYLSALLDLRGFNLLERIKHRFLKKVPF